MAKRDAWVEGVMKEVRKARKRAVQNMKPTDAETLRRVRDFIEDEMCRQQCEAPILYGDDILTILNGTERKGKTNGN